MSSSPIRPDVPAPRPRRRRGPRRDGADTRGAVLEAARSRFAAHGYDGTKLRDVAADADVDVALVSYHFGSKDQLFAAAMALDVNPAQLVQALARDGADGLGERLVRLAAAIESPEPELRAALTGSQLVGVIMARYVVRVGPIARADRETLVAAIGPTLQRYLTGEVAT